MSRHFYQTLSCITLLFLFSFSPLHSYADGWSRDDLTGKWTYVQLYPDGPGYSLKKGWHHDEADGHDYYFHDETGHMLTGYHVIGDKLCYFKEEPNQGNYWQHENSFWYYDDNGKVPLHMAKVNGRFCEAKRTRSVITGQINKA